MSKHLLIIALTFIVSVSSAQTIKDSLIHAQGNYIPADKIDTVLGVFLEIPSGTDLNPVSWSIEDQSEITLKWCRGYAIMDTPSPSMSFAGISIGSTIDYLYFDRKTKVKNKVIIFYEIKYNYILRN